MIIHIANFALSVWRKLITSTNIFIWGFELVSVLMNDVWISMPKKHKCKSKGKVITFNIAWHFSCSILTLVWIWEVDVGFNSVLLQLQKSCIHIQITIICLFNFLFKQWGLNMTLILNICQSYLVNEDELQQKLKIGHMFMALQNCSSWFPSKKWSKSWLTQENEPCSLLLWRIPVLIHCIIQLDS